MDNRIIPIVYDLDLKGWATDGGSALRAELNPRLYLNEYPYLNITFKKNGNPYAMPSSGVNYLITVDNDYETSTDPYMKLGTAAVNEANSWRENDGSFRNPVPGNGEMTIALTGAQADFLTRIGSASADENTKIEIQLRDGTTNELEAVYVAPLICSSLLNKGSPPSIPPPSAPAYVTTDQITLLAKLDVDWTTAGDYDVTVPAGFIIEERRVFGDKTDPSAAPDLAGLVYDVGEPGDTDKFALNAGPFAKREVTLVDEEVSGTTIRITVKTPAANGANGKAHFKGYVI